LPSAAGNKEVEFFINLGNLKKKIWRNPKFEIEDDKKKSKDELGL